MIATIITTIIWILLAILLAFVMRVIWKRVNPQCPCCGARLWSKRPGMDWRCCTCSTWYDPATGHTYFL